MPQGFFNLIGRNPNDAARYDFKSVEIKETAFRLDGVFVPKNEGDPTYFVEAQFQTDEHFYARFFCGSIFVFETISDEEVERRGDISDEERGAER
ncbi:MAG: DUF2887 domain-containing protein [Chloroherpetonaceae bacterium]